MQKMSEKEALETLKTMYPKKCKMVDGRLKGGFDNHECKEGQVIDIAIQALKEMQQYRATGMTAEQIKEMQMDYCAKGAVLEEYKAIGTVEECREAVERMKPKKTRKGGVMGFDGEEGAYCPNCGLDNIAWGMSVCVDCGQRLDWEE